MVLTRTLLCLAALPALLTACAPAAQAPTEVAAPSQQTITSPQSTPLSNPLPAAPAPTACGDPVATLSTRDKLAQLLMVGVSDGADARAVVAEHHVGGIFVGS